MRMLTSFHTSKLRIVSPCCFFFHASRTKTWILNTPIQKPEALSAVIRQPLKTAVISSTNVYLCQCATRHNQTLLKEQMETENTYLVLCVRWLFANFNKKGLQESNYYCGKNMQTHTTHTYKVTNMPTQRHIIWHHYTMEMPTSYELKYSTHPVHQLSTQEHRYPHPVNILPI